MTKDEIILAQQARIEQLVGIVNTLWNIIDDIDTYGDVAKDYDRIFREMVECRQKDRWITGITTDGHALIHPALSTTDDLSALRAHDAALTAKHIEICKKLAAENEGLAGEVWCERCADAIEKGGVL